MNWKLTREASNEPEIDEWSEIRVFRRRSLLDEIYEHQNERGLADDVQRAGPGRYWVRRHLVRPRCWWGSPAPYMQGSRWQCPVQHGSTATESATADRAHVDLPFDQRVRA